MQLLIKAGGSPSARRLGGFSLIELMVTLAIAALMLALAVPYYKTWIANSKVRSTAEQMVANLRQAQAEAVKRYRRVVFYRSGVTDCSTIPAYSATGNYWVILTIPLVTGDQPAVAQCGTISDGSSNIQISGWTAMCYGTNGRPIAVAAASTGIGVACAASTAFDIDVKDSAGTTSLADRPLRVNIAPGGGIRMCDPKRSLDLGNPDGC